LAPEEIEIAGFRLNAIISDAVSALAILASVCLAGPQAAAQQRATREVVVRQIASNLYFLFDFEGSNSVFLLIDTRTHPREGRDLLDRIRKVTDKPIKWVINSHFHGDHHMGNIVFKELGATFVAQEETARTWSMFS
jgi:glyoxylase-like metal-dependent hydrolase (beta-lactamase superfamily II)